MVSSRFEFAIERTSTNLTQHLKTMSTTCKQHTADGKTPTINSPCECNYAGTLIDGTEFDSSYKRGQPSTFAPNQVIK